MTSAGAPLNQSGSTSFTIGQLVAMARDGQLRVPSFQRAYVWNAGDVRALFDSLYRGFPVGTLLLWKRAGAAGEVEFGPIKIEASQRSDALWVVDGQQRIISLVGTLSTDFAGIDKRFDIYFDLSTEKFLNSRGGQVPRRAMPLREALETKSFLHWLRSHDDELEPGDFDAADKLGEVFREYRIPAYVVTDDNQNTLREVFDRVNSAGKPISRAQVFHALFASESTPGSPQSVSEALSNTGFGSITDNRIVQSLLAIRGGDVQRDLHDEFEKDEDPLDWYDRTEQALVRVISFLRTQGVPHLLLMPNSLPLPVLAAFFHLHPEPEPWIIRLLGRWLWRGWVHEFGKEGGQTPVIRRAIRSIYPDRLKQDNVPSAYDAVASLLRHTSDREPEKLNVSSFRTDRAEARLILLALLSLKPRDSNGKIIDVGELLNEYGTDAVAELVNGHRNRAASRGFWPPDAGVMRGDLPVEVLQSQAIDDTAATALRIGDLDGFIKRRESSIKTLVHDFLVNRMEVGALMRPPLDDLLFAGREEE